MSAFRNSKSSGDGDFETYRQMAPESFSDEKLLHLIKSKEYKREAIVTAIENVWHDTPDQQAVGSEWITASKLTKKDSVKPPFSARKSSDSGSKGTGKVRDSTGGRGSSDKTKIDKGKPQIIRVTPAIITDNQTIPIAKQPELESTISGEQGDYVIKSSWGSGPSFAEKIKLQELVKNNASSAENKKASVLEIIEDSPVVTDVSVISNKKSNTTPRTRNRKSKVVGKKSGEEIVPSLANVDVESLDLSTVLQNAPNLLPDEPALPATSASSLDASYLKLGKWDTISVGEPSSASTEMFQFGSFGNFSAAPAEVESVKTTSGTAWGNDELINADVHDSTHGNDWTDATSNDSSVVPSIASATIASIFSHKASLDVSVRAPPPGLEQNGASQINSIKTGVQAHNTALRVNNVNGGQGKFPSKDVNVNQHAPILQNTSTQQLYPQQQQYSQQLPPGITAAAGNRNSLSTPSNLPYVYSPSFDLSSPQFVHPAYSNNGANLSTLTTSSAITGTPSTVSLPTGSTASTTGVPQNSNMQSLQQQQQYAAPAPFPFYGNPYYNQAAYYYGQPQVPNYFGQQGNRGLYQQQQSPYGTDPYANSGSLYQHGGQPQQFADSSTSYGVLPSHQNMNSASINVPVGASSNNGPNAKSTPNKGSVTNNVGIVQQTNALPQDLNVTGNYGYMNPYNPRPIDAQAWQYQQNQAAWGGPMMSFPSAAVGSGTLHGGFVPQQQSSHNGMNISPPQQGGQQQSQQQSGNSQRNVTSTNTTYGGVSSFVGGRSAGPISSATTGTPQGW